MQASPLWELPFERVITLNMDQTPLNDGLNAVERSLGLPETDFGQPAFRNLRETHYAHPRPFAGSGPIETHRFRPEEAKNFPKRQLTASPLIARMARRHYAADQGRVASGDTAGELFQPAAMAAAAG